MTSTVPGSEAANAYLALPLWMAGALAAFFLVVCVIALNRDGPTRGMRLLVTGILLASAGLVSLALVQGQGASIRAQRAHVLADIADLNGRALAQGAAPLACLTGAVGDAVEPSCERVLFASPESTAAALAFVEMQVALLSRASAAQAADAPEVQALRRSVETDRYGLAAQVFGSRLGCASEHCAAFAVLQDGARIRANLKTRKYEVVVRRYAGAWPVGQAPVLAQSQPQANLPAFLNGMIDPATALPTTNGAAPIDYPSADSIPPISIMNAEPAREPAAEPKKPPAAPAPAVAAAPRRPASAPLPQATAAPLAPPLDLAQ